MKHHKLFYGSSYDRGLEHLLKMWSDIIAKYPDATLDIAYGWKLFDMFAANNPERMEWKELMVELMKQPGITEHGRLGKEELSKLREQCGIWAYPAHFTEINCITALESQRAGLVPVTTTLAALKETVGAGVKVEGDIYDKETQQAYLEALLGLMGDPVRWETESKKAVEFAKDYDWSKIATDWTEQFESKPEDIKVSIITPTIRKGWWNIMANNIASQTYKNIEWLIVDDYKENREHIAKEYAKKYKLDIKYYRGKPRKKKRTYGLVNANNTGLLHSRGDLLVILQDFVLMPKTGVEQLVVLHRQNPDALIAPCDIYKLPKVKPDIDSEDWFNGDLDVEGQFLRQNVRIKNEGVRETDNPYDFEQNYGAIPRKVAQDLGGWFEFYDEGLGFDNTDIALRAMLAGYKVLVDDTNICVCIDHWEALMGTRENVIGRARKLNDPRYIWAMEMLNAGKLPVRRTQSLDDKIELLYDIPETVHDDDVVRWLKANGPQIVLNWLEEDRNYV